MAAPCSVVPGSFTVIVSECDPVTGLYSLSGNITFGNAPGTIGSGTTGFLAVGTTCSGGGTSPVIYMGPWPTNVYTLSYSITGLISNGFSGCVVNATFYDTTSGITVPAIPACVDVELEFTAPEPCSLDFRYYEFVNCCTGDILNFSPGPLGIVISAGIYLYTGLSYGGLEPNTCYTINNGSTQDASFFGSLLPVPANSAANYTEAIDCNDTLVCPPCEVPCYRLYSCDGTIQPFNTYTDLSAYIGTFIEINLVGEPSLGCFYVHLVNAGTCADAVEIEIITENCSCDCICYVIIGTAKTVFTVDCDGVLTASPLNGYLQICSSVYPTVSGIPPGTPIPTILNSGLCVDGACLPQCFELEDCDGILDPIYTFKPSLFPYAILGQVVVLDGYPDTCWVVTGVAECDCAIDVTVLQAYDDCIICQNAPKYKLINCDNDALIVYTSTDLSAYVGQVITRLDCEGCWYVEEIDEIPSDVIITVDIAYTDCIECAREYFILTDCTGYKDPIITYTDLTIYIGAVIKIKYCPETCWTVDRTDISTNAGIVIPDIQYVDCPECLLTFPCICTTVRNDSDLIRLYEYYDCELVVQSFTLLPGETSERFCIRVWAEYYPETDYIVTFGNCSQESLIAPWLCPPIIYPRRDVRPGYSSPACTTQKYEKISCKAADVYYKQVLYLRYGISDCCPEENEKWLIKKELIDMDAINDLNYECTVINPCCPSAPTCNCTSLNTTCNSQ